MTARISMAAASTRPLRSVLAVALLSGLAGCATISEYLPTLPKPSFRWLYDSKKPGPLPEL
jgi:type IV pilus biogenesis protein CpaD/CtpE